jgi:hypothetical protein
MVDGGASVILRMVDQTGVSWNQIAEWLVRLQTLRLAV